MQISIRYFTVLRELTGKKEETLTFTEQKTTITLILKILTDKYGKPFTEYVFDPEGQVKSSLQLLINGTNITNLNEQETALQEGDVLAFLPPINGG